MTAPAPMGERLAVLETRMGSLEKKVDDMAGDVKKILTFVDQATVSQVARDSVYAHDNNQRRRNVDLALKVIPLALTAFSFVVAVIALVVAGTPHGVTP